MSTYRDIAESLKQAVRCYGDRRANVDGLALTPVRGLSMKRIYVPGAPFRSMYRPMLCVVLQGAKVIATCREERLFRGGQCVIVGADLPVMTRIVEASEQSPFLALAVEIDMTVMQSVAIETGTTAAPRRPDTLLFTESLDETILGCVGRLMRLIDHPEAIPVLRPAILRELHYWLLSSRHGRDLRRICAPSSHVQRIARAVEVIRTDFRKPIRVARLAAAAKLSVSTFARHFRAVTSVSPHQFVKQLRLIEARRLMLTDGYTASRAAFEVGYRSPSQFSREYAGMFGAPPRRDKHSGVDACQGEAWIADTRCQAGINQPSENNKSSSDS